nr:zinc knuckle CX2CX4HX4C [Tanacetum cinerariifolium]
SSFAWCLIKVNSEADFVEVVTIGVPLLTRDDFTKETICVKYEWRPHRCDICKIFGHVHEQCLKKVVTPLIVSTSNVVTTIVEKANDGFQMMGKKKKRNVNKSLLMVNTGNSSNIDNITSSNSFFALNIEKEDEEEGVENVYEETTNLSKIGRGSSFTAVAG